jgi:hypothetical protein
MVHLSDAIITVPSATLAAIRIAAPLIPIVVNEIGVVSAATALLQVIVEHYKTSLSNDDLLAEAKGRADGVFRLLGDLTAAEFDERCPSFNNLVEAVLGLERVASKWANKSSVEKRFSVSVRKGTSIAFKYRELFASSFELLDRACEELSRAVAVGSFANLLALQEKVVADCEERRLEFNSTSAALSLASATLADMKNQISALAEDTQRAEARAEERLTHILETTSIELAAAVSCGSRQHVAVNPVVSGGLLELEALLTEMGVDIVGAKRAAVAGLEVLQSQVFPQVPPLGCVYLPSFISIIVTNLIVPLMHRAFIIQHFLGGGEADSRGRRYTGSSGGCSMCGESAAGRCGILIEAS